MSESRLNQHILSLVDRIYDEESLLGKTDSPLWRGRTPGSSEYIDLTFVGHGLQRPRQPRKATKCKLSFEDVSLEIYADVVTEKADPTTEYFFENLERIYTVHDHKLCLQALRRPGLRQFNQVPEATPLFVDESCL